MSLKTDYKNYVPTEDMGGLRRYTKIDNPDGTVSFQDVTTYEVEGSKYGADDANATNKAINTIMGSGVEVTYEEGTVKITAPEGMTMVTFIAPSNYSASDKYTINDDEITLSDLNGEPLDDAWKQGSPVTLTLNGNKAFFKAGGMGKLPSDLAPLCPNFTVERNGTKVKISADKIQLNSYTNMVSGGVWAWGKTRPTKPTGENTKQWSRAELITTVKPYDGLYLGDVTPSDAVTETLIYLPENDSGSVKLVPFLVLSTDYLGGVYVMRKYLNSAWKYAYGYPSTYAGGGADTFLTSTYIASVLHESVSSQLLTCTVPFRDGYAEDLERKCWIPSLEELFGPDTPVEDGTYMPYFNSSERRKGYIQDTQTADDYLTRTPQDGTKVFFINERGSAGQDHYSGTAGKIVRPCFVLPKDFKIQQRPDGSYTVWNEQGLLTLGDIEESTDTIKVVVNIAEVDRNVPVLYLSSNYNGTERGLIRYLNSAGVNTTWGSSSSNFGNSTLKGAVDSYCESKLSESVKNIVSPVTIKITNAAGSDYTTLSTKYFVLSSAEYGGRGADGTPIAFFSDNTNRSGFTHHTRSKFSPSEAYYVESAGAIGTASVSNTSIPFAPAFTLPLDTPIRALADGTYDLVPDDPALSAQGVSTMADEEEVPLEVEFDWPESDPLIARQWVYNEKGVYQTMLLGGVASTEDAPAFELPTFTGNHAIFGDEIAGRIELYESGDLTLSPGTYDFFLVGGGSGSSYDFNDYNNSSSSTGTSGGGAGYTLTIKDYAITSSYPIPVIVGGPSVSSAKLPEGSELPRTTFAGNPTSIGLADKTYVAEGGKVTRNGTGSNRMANIGYDGGSGGSSKNSGPGGSDGSNGSGSGTTGGLGQGTTTRAFGDSDGTLYAGGGGGFQTLGGPGGGGNGATTTTESAGTPGTPNTGGGAGGSYRRFGGMAAVAAGGSGIVIVRWNNA